MSGMAAFLCRLLGTIIAILGVLACVFAYSEASILLFLIGGAAVIGGLRLLMLGADL